MLLCASPALTSPLRLPSPSSSPYQPLGTLTLAPILLSTLIITKLKSTPPNALLNPLHATEPIDPILRKLLDLRLELRLHQVEVVERANPHDVQPREVGAQAVHERAAGLAEVVCHGVVADDGCVVGPGLVGW